MQNAPLALEPAMLLAHVDKLLSTLTIVGLKQYYGIVRCIPLSKSPAL